MLPIGNIGNYCTILLEQKENKYCSNNTRNLLGE